MNLKIRLKLFWHALTHFHRIAWDDRYPDKSFCWDCDYMP